MPNTRSAAKRAKQSEVRQTRNRVHKSKTKTAVKKALEALTSAKDAEAAKAAYLDAVKTLSKTASRGVIPARRAARKISRLTELAKKTMPEALPFVAATAKKKTAKKAAAKA